MKLLSSLALLLAAFAAPCFAGSNGLVAHEWGTFTSFQDERGNAIGGINIDDEPVPPFVHRLKAGLILNDLILGTAYDKGIPACHPDVTMRLETPVIYFHRAPGDRSPHHITVSAQFNGGWISEWFPYARIQVDRKDVTDVPFKVGRITAKTTSRVTWKVLLGGKEAKPPETTWHVWTTPRQVKAADVTVMAPKAPETERYVFYRGVGHINAPLRVIRDASRPDRGGQLDLFAQIDPALAPQTISHLWLASFRDDGACAFKELHDLTLTADHDRAVAHLPGSFDSASYSPGNLATLKTQMHAALVKAGLFDDEGRAMLNTWDLSYFKSAGLRLFFIVPRPWTDKVLPLSIPAADRINRVMVGRIELVTPRQRQELGAIAAGTLQPEGQTRAYESLGRFREALILNEARRHPTAALSRFMTTYRIDAFALRSN